MAHLWIRHDEADWAVLELKAARRSLTANDGDENKASGVELIPVGDDWVILAAPGANAWANGSPLGLGIKVLRDKDELRHGPATAFFSTERLAVVEPFPGADREIICPRCRMPIEKGTAAVRCPGTGCGAWYHQSEQWPCFTYSATCALCDTATDLDADFVWYPGGL